MEKVSFNMLDQLGAATRPTGWKLLGDETFYLFAAIVALVSLFFTFYVLVWYSYLEHRMATPKELANALNRLVIPELFLTIPLSLFFVYGGYPIESAFMGFIALWAVVRYAMGVSYITGDQVYEKQKFREGEAYAKMALYGIMFVYSLIFFLFAMQEAYSEHHHMMKHIDSLAQKAQTVSYQ